jgi:hypothetical protein
MISYATYKLIHIIGILLVFLSLGGRVHQATVEGRGVAIGQGRLRAAGGRALGVTNGIGLFLILLGGFGLMARMGVTHGLSWPGWLWAKVAIWITFGVLLALTFRSPALARPLWLIVPLLGATAAYLALFKPF